MKFGIYNLFDREFITDLLGQPLRFAKVSQAMKAGDKLIGGRFPWDVRLI